MEKSAVIVGDYRYLLGRVWTPLPHEQGYVNFIMLNPSTADHEIDDPTITRCADFAWRWGFDGMYITNLFAYRSPYPAMLKEVFKKDIDVVGPDNDYWIKACASSAAQVVLAWGNDGALMGRSAVVVDMLYSSGIGMATIGDEMTMKIQPKHPLYLRKDLMLNHLNFVLINNHEQRSTIIQESEKGTS